MNLLIYFAIAFWSLFGGMDKPLLQEYCRESEVEEKRDTAVFFRESITFILGEDQSADNPYYSEAKKYYRYNVEAHTEYLVDSCRSLLAVRNYLSEYPPANGLPWGTVNLVLHSNEWSGMGVALLPGGKRTNKAGILAAVASGDFLPVSDAVLDEQSTLVFYGCAMGKNEAILKTLSQAFGGRESAPVVASSKYFIFYESQKLSDQSIYSQRYLTDYYYAFYKTGYRPGDIRLSRQLAERYPEANIHWRDALRRTAPREPGEVYHHTFKVPVVWTVTYADEAERPQLQTEAQQQAWLSDQEALQAALDQYGIPKDRYQWTFRKIEYTYEDGSREPAIKAIGFCTILCVLKGLVEEDAYGEKVPIKTVLTDRNFFGIYDPRNL